MRIELSIKTTYLPDWRTTEGVRELIQNAKDAETEFKAPMEISHDGRVLRIENAGVALPHEALLLGHTTKAENPHTIGHFGEGLKLGVLALVRAGHVVKIMSGSEIWTPVLTRSASFLAEVLAFDIVEGAHCGGVVIEVDKIPLSEWIEMRNNFLFLRDDIDKVPVHAYGDLLLDSSMVGKVFVKGILVQRDPKLLVGYNLLNAPTDRDRKVIPQWDLGWRIAYMWAKAVSSRPDLVERLYNMLESSARDVEEFSSSAYNYLSGDVRTALAAIFTRTFGEDAVPVDNIMESKELAHLGKKGVVLAPRLAELLQSIMGIEGGIEGVKRKVGAEVVIRHSWMDLAPQEQVNIERSMEIIKLTGHEVPADRLDIVSFRSDNRYGLWHKGRIMLSKAILSDLSKTLMTMIHEYAHHASEKGDGDKSHILLIEQIWAKIFSNLNKEG